MKTTAAARSDQSGPASPLYQRGGPSLLVVRCGLVVLVSLALGGLTSPAQMWLPDALAPFANSPSGWTILTALIIWVSRERTLPSAAFGAASFVSLVLGYQLVSDLRGYPDSEEFFLVAAVVVGPFIGAAASWVRRRGFRGALGCGVLAGAVLGDALSGLVRVEATTGWFYWTLVGALALLIATFVAAKRMTTIRDRALTGGTTLGVAAAIILAFELLG